MDIGMLNHKIYCLLSAAEGDFFEDSKTLERFTKELPNDLKEFKIDISVDGISLENLNDYIDVLYRLDEITVPI